MGPQSVYRITVDTFNRKLPQKEQLDAILTYKPLPFEGAVNLENAQVEFSLLGFYYYPPKGEDNPDAPQAPLKHVYFARKVSLNFNKSTEIWQC